ncbi:MAG: hypothetical protein GIX03_14070 [Candidatus Eremiobacteraeota bacterium]|nr:hypothetical protein [Candidatus Eremiobacteraeota bacterium]MBC5821998.1 hypothetical protein [Candidatus Eremiobacteraeota bacterium]
MPRTRRSRRVLPALALALGCAALGPDILHAALAAAAGSLFEAAPFGLAAELVPRRWHFGAQLAGCGCAGRVPGALSLAATALCWIAFGPPVALARFGAGLAVMRFTPPRHDVGPTPGAPPDALDALLVLAPCAAAATAGVSALLPIAPHLTREPLGPLIAFALGMALGTIAPCATAAVAIAAALAPHVSAAAAGLLLTGGLVQIPGAMRRCARRSDAVCAAAVAARFGLAAALALLAQRGAAGFVNPRLLPLIVLGALLALASACRALLSTRRRTVPASGDGSRPWPSGALVPVIMLGALAAGSPVPRERVSATQLVDAYPGERLSFVGTVQRGNGGASMLERYEITCCRADAAPIVIRLTSRLPLIDGTWVAASGVLASSARGLALRLGQWKAVAPPADPFVYR